MTQPVQLPGDLLKEAGRAAKGAGFPTTDEVISRVVADKLREIHRTHFYEISDRVRKDLAERGETPGEVLEDSEQFRRS